MHQSPLHRYHVDQGARFVDFAGWEMPILYRSILEEHKAVRTRGGVFDVSHMGRLKISGAGAEGLLERVLTRRVGDMAVGRCRYSLVCNDRGGVLDDVLVYRFSDRWMLVVNASNREKIVEHLKSCVGGFVARIEDHTAGTAMLALQGPVVVERVSKFSREVAGLKRYGFCVKSLLGSEVVISRTGYTGEDGVEIILPAGAAELALKMIQAQAGGGDGGGVLQPCGLGARDTLRMEAGMPLYGHELGEETDPLGAGLGFAVSLDKPVGEGGGFIGQTALEAIAGEAGGPSRVLIGLKLEGRRTARQGMRVVRGGADCGEVTSGCLSPTLGYPIAMAYVSAESVGADGPWAVLLGAGRELAAERVELPFYRAKSS